MLPYFMVMVLVVLVFALVGLGVGSLVWLVLGWPYAWQVGMGAGVVLGLAFLWYTLTHMAVG